MSKQYHILVGKYESKDSPFEMIFGDYVKSVVIQEKADTDSHYVSLRVITLAEDNQSAIFAAVHKLNS